MERLYLRAMHSVVDFFAYAQWINGSTVSLFDPEFASG